MLAFVLMFGLVCACFGLNGALVVFFIGMFCRVLVAVAFACGLLAVVLFIGVLIVVTGTVGWILWALVFRWHPIRIFYDRHASWVDAALSLALAGFGISMLYSFGRMAVESFS